ncbi:MAG: DedA family protein [Thermoanaerobaculia bacterium]
MQAIRDFLHLLFSVEGLKQLIQWGGLAGLVGIIFAETGLLIGFFLPGDTLLFTAGLLSAATGEPRLILMLICLSIAAILGDSTGYAIGRRTGPALYSRPDSRFFKQEHLQRAKSFYEKWGGITIVLARFVPVVRTFAPMVAGIARMDYRRFVTYNVFGGILWIVSVTLIGYFFGQIPFVQKHLEKIILGAIAFHAVLVPVIMASMRRLRHKPADAPE